MHNPFKPKFLFSTAPPPALDKYVGKYVRLPTGEKIEIKSIVGNRFKPQFYEINGQHLMGMLRFHAQMLGVKDIPEDQFKAFEEMDIDAKKRSPLDG